MLQTEADVIGYQASIGLQGWSEEKEGDIIFVIEPQARLYGRHRLRRDLAWEAMGTVLTTLGSGKKGNGVPLAVTLKRKKRYRRDGKGLTDVHKTPPGKPQRGTSGSGCAKNRRSR